MQRFLIYLYKRSAEINQETLHLIGCNLEVCQLFDLFFFTLHNYWPIFQYSYLGFAALLWLAVIPDLFRGVRAYLL